MSRLLTLLLVSAFLLDLGYSFYQYSRQPLSGDLVPIVLPIQHYSRVLEAPLGTPAAFGGERYAAPNRYAIHLTLKSWFDTVPGWLQNFVDPVDSVYAASALFKNLIHLGLCLVLAAYMFGAFVWRRWTYWLAVLAISLFSQAEGLRAHIGLIDSSVVYAAFYAWPLLLLLLLFFPFYHFFRHRPSPTLRLPTWQLVLCTMLAFYLAFSGPLVPPLAILTSGGILGLYFTQNKPWRIHITVLGFLFVFSLLCFYSLYVGTFNVENEQESPSLFARYLLMPQGFYYMLVQKIAWPLMLVAFGLSVYFFFRRKIFLTQPQMTRLLGFLLAISAAYLLLLPLGGYRPYRPYILRADTFLPVTLILLILTGSLARILLAELPTKLRRIYGGILLALILAFGTADLQNATRARPDYACERAALETLAQNPNAAFPSDCAVLSWESVTWDEEASWIRTVLRRWGVGN